MTNDDEVCIPSLSSILLAVTNLQNSFLTCSVANIGRKKLYSYCQWRRVCIIDHQHFHFIAFQ